MVKTELNLSSENDWEEEGVVLFWDMCLFVEFMSNFWHLKRWLPGKTKRKNYVTSTRLFNLIYACWTTIHLIFEFLTAVKFFWAENSHVGQTYYLHHHHSCAHLFSAHSGFQSQRLQVDYVFSYATHVETNMQTFFFYFCKFVSYELPFYFCLLHARIDNPCIGRHFHSTYM